MDILHYTVEAGILLAKVASILAIIYVPMIVGMRWLPRIDDKGFFLLPVVWVLALFTGVAIGGMLLSFNLPAEYFTVHRIFDADGPWSISYSQFIRERVNPFNYPFDPVLQQLRVSDHDRNLSILLGFAGTTYGLLAVRAFATWRSLGALRGILFATMVVIWSAYMTIFGVSLLFWMLNLMNFWSLALITYMIHLHRNHSLPINFQVLAAPVVGQDQHGSHGGHHHGGGHGGGHGGHGRHHEQEEEEEQRPPLASSGYAVPPLYD